MPCIFKFSIISTSTKYFSNKNENKTKCTNNTMSKANQLCMIDSGIATLDDLNLPESLINLNLHFNLIQDVSDNLTHLCNLKYLDLSSNKLSSTLGLSFCINLQVLNLASNRITGINGLEKLRY